MRRRHGVCTDASPPRVPPAQRAEDAYTALANLASLPAAWADAITQVEAFLAAHLRR